MIYKYNTHINRRNWEQADGTITFYLGQKTDVEKLEEENAELLFSSLTGEVM